MSKIYTPADGALSQQRRVHVIAASASPHDQRRRRVRRLADCKHEGFPERLKQTPGLAKPSLTEGAHNQTKGTEAIEIP